MQRLGIAHGNYQNPTSPSITREKGEKEKERKQKLTCTGCRRKVDK